MTRLLVLTLTLAMTLPAAADEVLLYWRPGSTGPWQSQRLLSTPGYYLQVGEDGVPAFVAPTFGDGSGDVVGPVSSVSSNIAVFNGATGKILMDGGYSIAGLLSRSAHTGTQSAATITGLAASATTDTTNANNIGTGTLADARLSSAVALETTANTFTQNQTLTTGTTPAWVVNRTGGKNGAFGAGTGGTFVSYDDTGFFGILRSTNANNLANPGQFGSWSMYIEADGDIGVGNIAPTSKLDVSGTVTATGFSGPGGGITGLNADNIASGTVPTARLGTGTADSTTYLRGDGTWQSLAAGSGDVTGPASSTADNLAAFSGTTGKILKDAGFGLSDVARKSTVNTFLAGQTVQHSTNPFLAVSRTSNKAAALGAGTTAGFISFDNAGDFGIGSATNANVLSAPGTTETWRMWIEGDTGRVGVGTNAPASLLDVAGTVTATGFSGPASGLTGVPAAQLSGIVPTANLGGGTANSTTYLRGDGNWASIPSGSGDVVGPAGSITADHVVAFDGTTGELLKSAGFGLSDVARKSTANTFSGAQSVEISGTTLGGGWKRTDGTSANQRQELRVELSNDSSNGLYFGHYSYDGSSAQVARNYLRMNDFGISFEDSTVTKQFHVDMNSKTAGLFTSASNEQFAGKFNIGGTLTTGATNNARVMHISTTAALANNWAMALYDASGGTTGTGNADHIATYQARQNHGSSGTLTHNYGFVSIPSTSGGTITNHYGFKAFDITGAGAVTNNYGIYVDNLTKGTNDYAIYTAGTTPSYFGGTVTAGAFVGDGSGLTGIAGGGDVDGPASSVSGNLPSFSGTTGKLLQDSGVAASNVAVKNANNQFTARQTSTGASGTVGGFTVAYTGGKAATLTTGTDGSIFSFDSSGGFGIGTATNSQVINSPGSFETYRMWIEGDTGEVGIGTTTPTEKLEVNGNVKATAFAGSGASLTSLNASNISSGTLSTARYTRTGVRRTVYVNAGAMIQVTSSTAPEAVTTRGTNLAYDSLAFDSATDETAGFWWTPPTSYDAGNVTIKTHWTCASGTAGDDVEFEVSAVAVGDDGVIDTAPPAAVPVLDEVLAAGDMHISSAATITIGGTPAANKPTYFRIKRDAQIAGDLAADARLLGVTIEFTESATEPAAQ